MPLDVPPEEESLGPAALHLALVLGLLLAAPALPSCSGDGEGTPQWAAHLLVHTQGQGFWVWHPQLCRLHRREPWCHVLAATDACAAPAGGSAWGH